MADRVYTEPTPEQLARFACVTTLGPGYTPADLEVVKAILDSPPHPAYSDATRTRAREIWRRRHRELQEQAWALEDDLR